MKFLALDVGEKRIGVARGDAETRIAIPVGYIDAGGQEWPKIAQMANFYGTLLFVVGLPRNNQGQETAQSAYVRNWAQELLRKVPGAKYYFQDESLTSVEAEERLKQRKPNYQKGEIDAEAAAIILQDFLDGLGARRVDNQNSTNPSQIEANSNQNLANSGQSEANVSQSETEPNQNLTNSNQSEENVTKKGKKGKETKKSKRILTKIMTIVVILGVLGAVGGAGLLFLREKVRAERAAEYAAQEAAMQAEVFEFTVKPGETIYDLEENLLAAGYSATEVKKALNADYDFDFLAERPEGATLEGYLFGETNEFYKSATATEVVEFFLGEMEKVIEENDLEAKFAEQGLTLHEGITLASVVQKEAPTAEMPTVAQVFLTRLDEGMALGSDVTVSYALDTIDPARDSHSDNQTALGVDSCYNTRLYKGLPCGPISNPGLEALLAVAEPSDTSYLYFLTGDDGLMYYSYTEAEHEANTVEHCQDLCQVSL